MYTKCENCGKELKFDEVCTVEEDTVCYNCVEIVVDKTRKEKEKLYNDDSVYIHIGKNAIK